MDRCPLKTGGINRVQQMISLGGVRAAREPGPIQLVARRFSRAGEIPAVVPDLDPRMIAALVRPQWRADESSGYADRTASVD